ncbi:MAG: site-specific integrase [Acidobacteriota bacterium]|nr:MAG: site-specific integrase [Acidobacteriota bacterium]
MTVRKRKDTGSWVSDFYYNGKRIVRTLKFARTKKEAEQAEAILKNKVFKQAYGLERRPSKTFEDFLVETFLPYSEANKKSFKCDVYVCRVLAAEFGKKKLDQIMSDEVEGFKQRFLNTPTKHGKPRSKTTVNYHLAVLSRIFSLAAESGLLETNPCKNVRKFRLNNRRTRVLSDLEEARLVKALKDNQLVRNIVIVALHTGMRKGEILDLKWFDVDLKRRVITVRKSKSFQPRAVPMNHTVATLLEEIRRESEYVFPSPKSGGKLKDFKRSFASARRKAGLRDFRFHDLRHTAATRMADKGADAFTLATILGHSDIRVTARYTHATDASIRNAVANLDSHFGNESATANQVLDWPSS